MKRTDYSLVVITRNRPQFLARLFHYYHSQQFAAPIFVGDSSSGAARDEANHVAKQFCKQLHLALTEYHETTPPLQRLSLEFAKVTTKYVAWVGDDDFLIPDALNAGAELLDTQPDCPAVIGKALLFAIREDGAYGNIASIGKYDQTAFTASSAAARLISYAQAPVSLTYCLRRTDMAQQIMRNLDAIPWPDDMFGYHFFEILDTMLLVTMGEIRMLENLVMVRQAHSASTGASGSSRYKAFHLVTHPRWPEFCRRMIGILAHCLADSDSISNHEAEELAELAIWIRVSGTLKKRADAELAKKGLLVSARMRPKLGRAFLNSMPKLRRFGILTRLRGSLSAGDYGNLMEIIRLVESAKT